MRKIVVIFLFILWALSGFAQQQGNERFVRVINRLVEAMNKQNYAGIVREYDSGMASKFPLDLTTILFKNYESQYGKVNKIDPPQVKAPDQAVCVMYFERGTQDLALYIDEQEKIKGFIFTTHVFPESQPAQESKSTAISTPSTDAKPSDQQSSAKPTSSTAVSEQKSSPAPAKTTAQNSVVTPKNEQPKIVSPASTPATGSPSTPVEPAAIVVPDKQQTELHPPFKGAWAVITGGELREGSAQRNLLQQQYAYEFSAKDTNGLRYKNDGKANEDYYGYGKEVVAPANGTVVEAIDGIRENSPGLRNPYAPIGNAVIIQHTNREYSVLAYLKQASIRVRAGDKVTKGQVIALCGNSGNATEPVIHYHLQDSPYLQTAKGIKFYFDRVIISKEGKKDLKPIHLPGIGETINPE